MSCPILMFMELSGQDKVLECCGMNCHIGTSPVKQHRGILFCIHTSTWRPSIWFQETSRSCLPRPPFDWPTKEDLCLPRPEMNKCVFVMKQRNLTYRGCSVYSCTSLCRHSLLDSNVHPSKSYLQLRVWWRTQFEAPNFSFGLEFAVSVNLKRVWRFSKHISIQ